MTSSEMLLLIAAVCAVWALVCTAALLYDKRNAGVDVPGEGKR